MKQIVIIIFTFLFKVGLAQNNSKEQSIIKLDYIGKKDRKWKAFTRMIFFNQDKSFYYYNRVSDTIKEIDSNSVCNSNDSVAYIRFKDNSHFFQLMDTFNYYFSSIQPVLIYSKYGIKKNESHGRFHKYDTLDSIGHYRYFYLSQRCKFRKKELVDERVHCQLVLKYDNFSCYIRFSLENGIPVYFLGEMNSDKKLQRSEFYKLIRKKYIK